MTLKTLEKCVHLEKEKKEKKNIYCIYIFNITRVFQRPALSCCVILALHLAPVSELSLLLGGALM